MSAPSRQTELRFFAGLVCAFLLTTFTWLGLWAVIPPLVLGWQPVAITSNSMAPGIRQGDVVLSTPFPGGELGSGTVVVFRGSLGEGLITHRVVNRSSDETYVTKGDANAGFDSTPLRSDQVVGVGRLLVPYVGLPLVWAWAGRWAATVAVLAAAMLLAWGARYGFSPRYDPWRTGFPAGSAFPERRRPGLHMARQCLLALLLMAAAVSTASHPAGAVLADSTSNDRSTFRAKASFADPLLFYLHDDPTPPIGDTTSKPVLPMDTNSPAAAALYNYDTNRDGQPGLVITKGGILDGSDPSRQQKWSYRPGTDVQLTGDVSLTVWSAMKDFDPVTAGEISAWLQECNPAGKGCTTIAQGSLNQSPWSAGSSTWVPRTVTLGSVDLTLGKNRSLWLTLVVGSGSGRDMWFAYDTAPHASVLSIQP